VNGHNYLDTYREGGIYDDPEYGSPYVSKGVKFARFNRYYLKPESKVVCIGCGNGFEVIEYLNQGHDAYGTEVHPIDVKILKGRIINAVVPNLPFKDKEFDLLHCTEVLEHVPEEETDDFLKECKRVSKHQFFSIATEKDSFNTHININKPGWWIDKFNENEMGIENFQFKPIVSNVYGSYHYEVYYTEGVTVLCRQV
jgi:ubiquinone/menaquinone biosynthesis C-methylase UbiE